MINVQQKGFTSADGVRKGASEAEQAKQQPPTQESPGPAAQDGVNQQSLARQRLFSAADQLKRTWETLRQSGKLDQESALEGEHAMAHLTDLENFDVNDFELLRKMSRATAAFKAAHTNKSEQAKEQQAPQKNQQTQTPQEKFQSQAREALSQLRQHMERVSKRLEAREKQPETPQQQTQAGTAQSKTQKPAGKSSSTTSPPTTHETSEEHSQPQARTEAKPQPKAEAKAPPRSSTSRGGLIKQERQSPSPPPTRPEPQAKRETQAEPSRQAPRSPRPEDSTRNSELLRGASLTGDTKSLTKDKREPSATQSHHEPEESESGPQLLRTRRTAGESFGEPRRASLRGAKSGFMPGRPGDGGRPLQAGLPGEKRQLSSEAMPRAQQTPGQPPRGAATGKRPVTSHIPIFNPVLDGIFESSRSNFEEVVEPISMRRPGRPDESGYLPSYRGAGKPNDPHQTSSAQSQQQQQQAPANSRQSVHQAAARHPLTGSMKAGEREGGGKGAQGGGAPPQAGTEAAEKANVRGLRLTSSLDAYRLSMAKLNTMVPTQASFDTASRMAGHSISALLKKLYRDEELDELDENTAVNSLGLILKMGGEFTYAHSARVLDLAMELADEVGISDKNTRKEIKFGAMLKDIGEMGFLLDGESDQKLDQIGEFMSGQDMLRAGLLHDIGKIHIPKEILYKPGRLTEEEYELVKMHPIYGEQIVYPIASLRHLCPTIRGHHERWDGKGYPDGLSGEAIPLPARVIAVADVFDALAAERPYKAGMEVAKVRRILEEGKATHFDPDLVEAFLRIIDRRYPELARKR
ncbi:MAG: HD domain-containing protein [Candidatus Eremiobacteraeota bacterium]|nr:HD domain-containing protein [Candidatus Eremiobacteraeota bacterium]